MSESIVLYHIRNSSWGSGGARLLFDGHGGGDPGRPFNIRPSDIISVVASVAFDILATCQNDFIIPPLLIWPVLDTTAAYQFEGSAHGLNPVVSLKNIWTLNKGCHTEGGTHISGCLEELRHHTSLHSHPGMDQNGCKSTHKATCKFHQDTVVFSRRHQTSRIWGQPGINSSTWNPSASEPAQISHAFLPSAGEGGGLEELTALEQKYLHCTYSMPQW